MQNKFSIIKDSILKTSIFLVLAFLFVFGFSFNRVEASLSVSLEGLDITNSPNGGFNLEDPGFSTGPIDIAYGGSVGFRWRVGSSINPNTCTNNVGISREAFEYYQQNPTLYGGSLSVRNIRATTTYFITCNGITASVLVRVGPAPAPTISLVANPSSVPYDGESTLTWTANNSTSCVATSNPANSFWNSNNKSLSGASTLKPFKNTTTFTLTCTGPSGSATANATVTVLPKPKAPTVTLTANPTTLTSGGNTTLNWTATDSNFCTASGGWSGDKNPVSGSQVIFSIFQNTTFTLTCGGPSGNANASVSVVVNPAAPVVNITANPNNVAVGGSTTLTWAVYNANSCTASDGWTGNKNSKNGTEVINNINQNTKFTLTCIGQAGTTSNFVNVTVLPPPTVTLTATPQNVSYGGGTQLTWSSSNATSCTASGDWTGNKSVNGGSQLIGNLTSEKNFILTCTNQFGQSQAEVKVTVNPQAPIVNISANPRQVAVGGATSITWISANATSCTASGGWTGNKSPTGGAEIVSNLNQNTTFTLTCNGEGGSANASVTVSVNPLPQVSLTANPQNVSYGGSTQLTWSSSNTNTCTASDGWTGNKNINGSQIIASLNQNTTFTLTCNGAGGSATSSVTVTVNPQAPVVNLTANPTSVQNGGSTTLTWSSTNANTCTASDGWTGNKATSGSEVVSNILANTVFTLTCTGAGGESYKSVNVSVLGKPVINLSANPLTVAKGETSTLTWNTQNATSCIASSNPVGVWQGSKNLNGSQSVTINQNTTFTLTCTGAGGESLSYLTVSVLQERVSLRNTRVIGGKTVLSWTLTNVKDCQASTRNPESGLNWGGGISNPPNTGEKSEVIVTAEDTTKKEEKNEYILSCIGNFSGDSVSQSLFLDKNDGPLTSVPTFNEN